MVHDERMTSPPRADDRGRVAAAAVIAAVVLAVAASAAGTAYDRPGTAVFAGTLSFAVAIAVTAVVGAIVTLAVAQANVVVVLAWWRVLLGIDAMQVQPIAEADAVARHYLGPDAEQNIRHSRQPDQTFAFAWTQLEARLKCHKRELTEWNSSQTSASASCTQRHFLFANRTAVTMVIASS